MINAGAVEVGRGQEHIAAAVEGHPSRPVEACKEIALHRSWRVLVDKAASVLAVSVNGSEQVALRSSGGGNAD